MRKIMTKLISTDLTIVKPETMLTLFMADGGVDPVIQEAKDMAEQMMLDADVTTKKGRDAIASNAYKFSTFKTAMDSQRKKSIEKQTLIVNAVNANGRKVKSACDELRDKVREPLNKWEAEKAEKQAIIDQHLTNLKNAALNHNNGTPLTLDQLQENKISLEMFKVTEEVFAEYTDEAKQLKSFALETVIHNISMEQQRLDDEEELNRLREAETKREAEAKEKADAEEAERLAKEHDDKIKADAIREQEEKYEREKQARLQAEEDARNANAKAELEQEQKAQAEQEKLERAERDKRHVGKVRAEAVLDMIDLVELKTDREKLVKAISDGKIRHVSISYAK